MSRDIHGGAAFSALPAVDARAVGATGAAHLRAPETSLAPQRNPIAPAHLHGMDDTSIHLCLPSKRAAELCDRGRAEPHQYGDCGSKIMVYSPVTNPS